MGARDQGLLFGHVPGQLCLTKDHPWLDTCPKFGSETGDVHGMPVLFVGKLVVNHGALVVFPTIFRQIHAVQCPIVNESPLLVTIKSHPTSSN